MHACSVAGPSDVAGIRVLRASLDAWHPGAALTVAALPGARRRLAAIGGIDVVPVAELAAGIHGSPGHLPVRTLRALARPLLLRRLLGEGAPCALLLAADCDVRAPLVAIEDALDRSDVVALARVDGRLPDDGEHPDAEDLRAAGPVDDAVVAARAGAPVVRCLYAWREAVVHGTGLTAGRALPSALPEAAPGLAVLADPGYGLSAWNLHDRPLGTLADGVPRAAGRPIALVRFAGFRPDRPWWLSGHATRVRVLGDAVLARLCRERAAALLAAGWEPPHRERAVADGGLTALGSDDRTRRLLRAADDAGVDVGEPRSPEDEGALRAWLAGPAETGARAGVNRYTHDLWWARGDVRHAYPDLDGADGEGFVRWLWVHGRSEAQLDERLLPPRPDGVDPPG